MKKLPKGRLLT